MPFLSDADASVFKNVYMDGFLDVSSQLIVRGNVGIGTTNPTEKVVIHSSSTGALKLSTSEAAIPQTPRKLGIRFHAANTTSHCGMFLDAADDIGFYTFGSKRLHIQYTGRVGIGTDNPLYALDVTGQIHSFGFRPGLYMDQAAGGVTQSAKIYLEINNTLTFVVQGFAKMYLRPDSGVVIDNFTGQHRAFIKDIPFSQINPYIGLIVVANQNKYISMNNVPQTGINAININETLPGCSLSKKEKDKSCYGVISGAEDENQRETELGNGVVIPYQKEDGDTRIFINSLGEGAIWVSNKNGPLESGDYITTSDIPGYGQKQDSEFLANYTVAKITMDCDFNPLYQPSQTILKDASGNNILDSNGEIQWTDELDTSGNIVYEYAYNIRYLDLQDTRMTKVDYDTKLANGEQVYIAAFVGCTYHCG